jgi:hypothetical protein
MKNHSTGYFWWTISLIINLFMVGALMYGVQFAFTAKRQTMFDFDAMILPPVAILTLGLALWETIIIIDFLFKDVRGKIILEKKKRLTIVKGGSQEILDYKDLTKIEFAGPRDGSRSLTASWTYAKLTFKNRVLFLTSLTVQNEEIKKEFGLLSSKTVSRGRRFFELIK